MTRCEVWTLPPTTAAVDDGLSTLWGGILISTGVSTPWFNGMSLVGSKQRKQYMTADAVTAGGAFKLP